MGTNSRQIFKQAFHLVKAKKSLWLAGLFLVWPSLVVGLVVVYWLAVHINYGSGTGSDLVKQDPIQVNMWTTAISSIVIILLFILYFRAKAYVALMVKVVKTNKPHEEPKAWSEAGKHVSALIHLSLGLLAALAIFLSLVSIPVNHLYVTGFVTRAWTLGVIGVVLFSPLLALFYLGMTLTPLFTVVYKLALWDSLRVSIDVSRRLWRKLSWFVVKLWIWQIVGLCVSITLMLTAMLPFVLFINIFYDKGGLGAVSILQGLAGTAGFMVFFMSQAMVAVFSRVAWAVLFFEIIKPVKTEQVVEEEAVAETVPME